jgi:signal transduction histidine kinase
MLRVGRRARLAAPVLAVATLLAAALALQLLAGGIRARSLGPVVLAMSVGALGGLIRLHRPAQRIGPLLTVTGLGFGLGSLAASALDYGAAHPIPHLAAQAAFAVVAFSRVLVAAWVLFILWFPEGHIGSRRWRAVFVASLAFCVAVSAVVWLVGPADRVFDFYKGTAVPPGAGGPFAGAGPGAASASDLVLLLPLVALGDLVQRFRRGDAVLREQVRWLLYASATTIVMQIVGATLVTRGSAFGNLGLAFSIATQPLPMIGATVAMLRYRLWDIDLVVSRTLVYAVLWAALSALLLVPALAAGLLVGGRDAATAVAIALLVTVVFHPARRRLEATAERLVYRHRTRPYVLLSGVWETLRAADLDRLGPLVCEGIRRGLQVEWAGLWLLATSPVATTLRPLGLSGATPTEAVALSDPTVATLHDAHTAVLDGPPMRELDPLWPAPPEAVVPLVAGEDLVGLLACGGRRGDRLRAGDFELLEMLGRECAMRLRNLRLEAQLRERLAQIEEQAVELARSRQRLVSAQDEERRRIERNLHDGVQQQLVALVARLHRAAGEGAPQLAALAAEAEDAVFALQELGRGIYPSVLSDQGLAAALRTQAARMPVTVCIEVDDALLGRRLDREAEAALYFVALEGLTNAYKHAGGASIAVWLHAEGETVSLEVVDAGPGFAARGGGGSGLQNMRDRMAAVGGTLAVHSTVGQGTRVSAAIPLGSDPRRPAQPVPADSRR